MSEGASTYNNLIISSDGEHVIFDHSSMGTSPDCLGCPIAQAIADEGSELLRTINQNYATRLESGLNALQKSDVENDEALGNLLADYDALLDKQPGTGDRKCSGSYDIFESGKKIGIYCARLNEEFYNEQEGEE